MSYETFVSLFLLGLLVLVVGMALCIHSTLTIVRHSVNAGKPWAIRLTRVARVTEVSFEVLASLVIAAGICVAVAVAAAIGGPLLIGLWKAIWSNLSDAYHADRMVKFVVWLAAAGGSGFVTLLAGAYAMVAVFWGFEQVGDRVSRFKKDSDAPRSDPFDSSAELGGGDTEKGEADSQRRVRARRWFAVSMAMIIAGLTIAWLASRIYQSTLTTSL